MDKSILVIVAIFITTTSTAPVGTRCVELLNSVGPYAYCNVTTNTSSQVDINRLSNLITLADNVTDTFQHQICDKEENKKVSNHMVYRQVCISNVML